MRVAPRWAFLHGFGGGPAQFDELRELAEIPDALTPHVVGHGGGGEAVSWDEEVRRLASLLGGAAVGRLGLCGYSLGGRLALSLALNAPDLVRTLVLIGVNPGLSVEEERAARRAADDRWAERIENEGAEAFFDAWVKQPLFATQASLPPGRLERQAALRRGLPAPGLAGAMRTLSLGRMPDASPRLGELECPVVLVVGSEDAKFRALAADMAPQIPDVRVEVVEGAGHNVVLERPEALARILRAVDAGQMVER